MKLIHINERGYPYKCAACGMKLGRLRWKTHDEYCRPLCGKELKWRIR